MTSDVNFIDIFSISNWSCKKLFSLLIKIWCFIRNWPACFEKATFSYAGSYCTSKSQGLPFGLLNDLKSFSNGGVK